MGGYGETGFTAGWQRWAVTEGIMRQWFGLAGALTLLLLGGCAAEQAGHRLQHIGELSGGGWMPIARTDFATGDPRQSKATTPGSQALQDAVIADAGIAAFVSAHGLPDAIAVGPLALSVDLAYLEQHTAYTLRHSASEAVTPRAWHESTVTGERPLTDADVERIDPDILLARQAKRLQYYLAGFARVMSVGRRVLLALPPPAAGTPPGEYYGVLTPKRQRSARVCSVILPMPEDVWWAGSTPMARRPDCSSRAT